MSFFKNVTKISTWTVGSRIGGFLREMLTAHFLGVGAIVDALVLALKIPSLIRRFTAEGTINSCFIPLFTSVYEKKGLKQAKLFAASVLSISVCILLTLSVLFALFTKPILLFLFPALLKTPDRMLYAIYFSRIMFPFVLFISITAVYGGVLNAIGRFTAFAASPFFGNLFIIGVVLVFLDLKDPTKIDIFSRGIVFAWAILFSGVVQLLVVLTDALRNDLFLPLLVPQKTPEIKSFFKRLGPSVMSSGIAQINIFVGLFIASWLPTGSISYLNYADRLVQLPLSVVGTAMGVALLPLLTKNLCQNKIQEANSYQETALAFSFLFSSFVFLAFVILSDFVVALVFKHGAFKSHDALATAKALAAYAWGLPAYIMIKILSARFFAKGQVKLPLIASAVSLFVDMALSILLARVMGHVGIAIATSVAAWVNVLGLSLLLHKHKEWTWPRHLLFFVFKVTLLSFSLIVALGHFMQGHFSYVTTKIDAVFYTGTLGLFLLMLFGVGLRVACWAEIQKIISLIKKKQNI
ncbi:MAG: murein biosynthesis integral membrane protein MurJ [Holosporaceae bacterium]